MYNYELELKKKRIKDTEKKINFLQNYKFKAEKRGKKKRQKEEKERML
jgi:hypothetical protein